MIRERLRALALPVLAAVYSVLSLAAGNTDQVGGLADVRLPLLTVLTVAVVAQFMAICLTRDHGRQGLIALACVVYFAAYSWLVALLRTPLWWLYPRSAEFAPILSFVLLGCVVAVLGRSRRRLSGLQRYATVTAVLVLVIPIWTLTSAAIRRGKRDAAIRDAARDSAIASAPSDTPNIYLIVLDKYTGNRSLLANYGFDNAAFIDFLQSRGFYVPARPRSNYVHTFLALASMLNWRYLDDLPTRFGRESPDWSLTYPLIENNRTWKFLRHRGYRFVYFRTGFIATSHNRFADLELAPDDLGSGFAAAWLDRTPIPTLLSWICRHGPCEFTRQFPIMPESAAGMDWKFDQLAQLSTQRPPMFVFAHLLLPHEPYIYGANCEHRIPYWPAVYNGHDSLAVKHAYLAQITCVNHKLEALIDTVLKRSSTPPIILLQADHGAGRNGPNQPPLSKTPPDNVRERVDPFAAYLVPPKVLPALYDSVSPVNVLPAVFNGLFDARIPALPDQSYWSSERRPYDFERIDLMAPMPGSTAR